MDFTPPRTESRCGATPPPRPDSRCSATTAPSRPDSRCSALTRPDSRSTAPTSTRPWSQCSGFRRDSVDTTASTTTSPSAPLRPRALRSVPASLQNDLDLLISAQCFAEIPSDRRHGAAAERSEATCVCGNVFMDDSLFCRKCGAKLPEQVSTDADQHHSPHRHQEPRVRRLNLKSFVGCSLPMAEVSEQWEQARPYICITRYDHKARQLKALQLHGDDLNRLYDAVSNNVDTIGPRRTAPTHRTLSHAHEKGKYSRKSAASPRNASLEAATSATKKKLAIGLAQKGITVNADGSYVIPSPQGAVTCPSNLGAGRRSSQRYTITHKFSDLSDGVLEDADAGGKVIKLVSSVAEAIQMLQRSSVPMDRRKSASTSDRRRSTEKMGEDGIEDSGNNGAQMEKYTEVTRTQTSGQSLSSMAMNMKVPLGIIKTAWGLFEGHALLKQCAADGQVVDMKALRTAHYTYKDAVDLLLQNGFITSQHFEQIVCKLAGVEDATALPDGLLFGCFSTADANMSGTLDFAEFADWFSKFGFTEDLLVSKDQKMLRHLARKHDRTIAEVEKYKDAFSSFDLDGSGCIEYNEFESLLSNLLNIPPELDMPEPRIKSFWHEADADNDGEVDFEEFLLFYMKYFNTHISACPIENFYRVVREVPGSPSMREVRKVHGSSKETTERYNRGLA